MLDAADQSIARLLRSKSRQKALELRNSTKGISKSTKSLEQGYYRASGDIKFSLSTANRACRAIELQSVKEDCVSTVKSLKNSDLGAVDLQSQEKEMNNYSGRITRSRSQQRLPEIVIGSPTRNYHSDNCKVDVSSDFQSLSIKDSANNSDLEKVDAGSKLDGDSCSIFIKDIEIDSGRIARSKTSESHRSPDSSKANSFDDNQNNDIPIVDFRNDLGQKFVDRDTGKTSLIDSEALGSVLSYDKSKEECYDIASLSSNPQNAYEYLDKPSASSQIDGGIIAASSEITKLGVRDSDMNSALIISSLDLDGRGTRSHSQTRSYPGDTIFEIEDSHKPGTNDDLQNAKSSQFSELCHVIHDLCDNHDNVGSVMANKLVNYPRDHGGSFSYGAKQRNEMEIQVARNPPDSFLFVGLRHLSFGIDGEQEFKNTGSNFGKGKLDISLKKMIGSLSCAATSQGGRCCEGNDKFSSESNSCDNKKFRSVKESRPETHENIFENIKMMNSSGGVIDVVKRHSEQTLKMSSYPEGEVCGQLAEPHVEEKNVAPCCTCRSPHGDNLSLERMSRHASLELQPQLKVRKIERRKCQGNSTSPSFWVNKSYNFQRNASTSMGSISHASMDSCDLSEGINIGFRPKMDDGMTEAVRCTFSSPDGEVGFSDEKTENRQTRSSLVSNLTNEINSSLVCFVERLGTTNSNCKSDDMRNSSDGQNMEITTLANCTIQGVRSPEREDELKTHDYLHSRIEDLELTHIDACMPLFEGFSVSAETDGRIQDHICSDIDFDKLNSSRSTIERASILAEICKSSSFGTPLIHFSSAVAFQDLQNAYASGNDILLDQSEFRSSVPSIDADTQQLCSATDDMNHSIECVPRCDFHPYPGVQYELDLGSRHPSPVGQPRPRPSSYSGSSEKHLGSLPYLMCFPIEEDPSTSEDNDFAFENADDVQRETDPSLDKNSENRKPLQDLTNLCSEPVAEGEKNFGSDKVVSIETSISGSQKSPRHCYGMRSVTGERKNSSVGDNGGLDSLNFSIGTNQIQKVNQSASSSLSKPIHLSKTSLCKQNEKVALKESKKTNIVSNISSFIPLIQHKQAAAAGPGKIDVKVKALKAAEAAKRLEEKRQIERNLRKEALKLERAKLEENNLRLRELEKRTEDGHKKKDADKLAKKRLRENDERKEKEQKKMRIQQRHHQQRDLKIKVRSVKAKEENQQVKDEKTNIREFPIKSEQRQEVEVLRKTDAKSIPSEVVNKDKCSTTSQPLETGEVICRAERSPPTEKLIVQRSTERSYDISPYQCSDDEDEGDDDNELPTKKHVPSWASKSSVAVHISLQLEMDADKIFPAESFCRIDEVLLPRIPRPKTHG